MDSNTDMDFEDRAASFSCMFSKDSLRASTERMNEIKIKLQDELDVDDDCYHEIISKLNFYTWIEFKLCNFKMASGHNERALQLSSWKNVTSIVNHAHLMQREGDETNAEESLDKAEQLRKGCEGDMLMTEVEAELAYSYSRLNGPENLAHAIEIYSRVVTKQPEIYAWKYRLGLAHRRATHGNMYTAMPIGLSHKEHIKIAANLLFDVTRESMKSSLRSRAYSQLAVMYNYSYCLDTPDLKEIFEGIDFLSLITEALKYGPKDARTLTECGRILRFSDLERATDLLEKSLQIKKHSLTLHHLGLCYDQKARNKSRAESKEKQNHGRRHSDFSRQRDEVFETDSMAHGFISDGRSTRTASMENVCRGSRIVHDERNYASKTNQRGLYSQKEIGCSYHISFWEYDARYSGGVHSSSSGGNFFDRKRQSGKQNCKQDERFRGNHYSDDQHFYHPPDSRHEGLSYAGNPNAYSQQYNSRDAKRHIETYHKQDKGFMQGSGRHQVYTKQDSRNQDMRFERSNSYSGQHRTYEFKKQLFRQSSRGRQSNTSGQRGFRGRTQNNRNSFSIIRCPIQVLPLNREDPLVKQAIECYTQALDISCDNNNPARYNLGLILRSCGDLQEAINQFNKIIFLTSGSSSKRGKNKENREHLITVTCAYEQAGLCLLDLANRSGKTEEEIKKVTKDGEGKLLQAVSLAATLSNSDPELKNHYNRVWNAFRTLETKYEGEDDSPDIIKKYIELLKLTSQFEKIPEVIDKLRRLSEDELTDPKVLNSGLESYLALKQYEDAFTFLSVSLTNHLVMDCLRELQCVTLKVRLLTAASRLQKQEGSAKLILKPLFDSSIKKDDMCSEGQERAEDTKKQQTQTNSEDDDVLDVLIVYDTDNKELSENVTEQVNKLQKTMSGDFGLDVNNINARRLPGTLKINRQTEEIARARTVLVLLSEDSPSSLYTSVLSYIPTIIMDCRENDRPKPKVLLGLTHGSIKIPIMLKSYNKIDMSQILDMIHISSEEEDGREKLTESKTLQTDVEQLGYCRNNPESPQGRASVKAKSSSPQLNTSPVRNGEFSGSSTEDFNDCTTAKMSLFCALINQEWTTFVKSP